SMLSCVTSPPANNHSPFHHHTNCSRRPDRPSPPDTRPYRPPAGPRSCGPSTPTPPTSDPNPAYTFLVLKFDSVAPHEHIERATLSHQLGLDSAISVLPGRAITTPIHARPALPVPVHDQHLITYQLHTQQTLM